MSRVNMTRGFVRNARCPARLTMIEYQDVQVPGLILSVRNIELKRFMLRYWDRDDFERYHYIGSFPEMPLNFARGEAELYAEELKRGVFPSDGLKYRD